MYICFHLQTIAFRFISFISLSTPLFSYMIVPVPRYRLNVSTLCTVVAGEHLTPPEGSIVCVVCVCGLRTYLEFALLRNSKQFIRTAEVQEGCTFSARLLLYRRGSNWSNFQGRTAKMLFVENPLPDVCMCGFAMMTPFGRWFTPCCGAIKL